MPTIATNPASSGRPIEACPAMVGRYRIIDVLGRGSAGTVYKAEDQIIQRLVALKTVPRPSATSSPSEHENYARFLRESLAAGRLSHTNVVMVFDVGVDETTGLSYIAMEFVEGEPLDRLLRRQYRLSLVEIRSIGIQVASALDAAHRAGIVHRDIKPANLILTSAGVIKVADFGIAKIASSAMTQDGSFLGSPSYMSPEQVRSGRVDHRSDLFSLGTVLYELLTLRSAFGGGNVFDVIQRVVKADVKPMATVCPMVPVALTVVVERAMSREREQRFASAREMRDALAGVSLGSGEKPPVREAPFIEAGTEGGFKAFEPDAPRSSRSGLFRGRRGTAPLLVGAAVAVAVAVVTLLSQPELSETHPLAGATAASPTEVAALVADPTVTPAPSIEVVASPSPAAVSQAAASGSLSIVEPHPSPTPKKPRNRATPVVIEPVAEPSPTPFLPPSPFPFHFVAVHSHHLGRTCKGSLAIMAERLIYDAETDHGDDRDWAYRDLKSASFEKGDLNLVVDEKSALGRDKRFKLKIQGGVIPAIALDHLLAKIAEGRRP